MANLIDSMHLGRDRVIGAYEVDGLIVDPGPASCLETLLAGLESEPRGAPPHPHPPRSRRRVGLARPRGSRGCGSTCTRSARRTWSTRRSCCRAPGGSTATTWSASGARCCPCRPPTSSRSSGGEEVEGFRVAHAPGHASHHVGLPPRADRRRLCRRHGRRAHPSARVHGRADAAAGHRRRGVGALARTGRAIGGRNGSA